MLEIMKFKMKDTYPPPKKLTVRPLRFLVYIDGFNLYKGINHEDPPDLLRLGWCDYQKLGESLVELAFHHAGGERTVAVKLFTAGVSKDTATSGEIERQKLWRDVLKLECPRLDIIDGIHVSRSKDFSDRKEKMTDVNIAIHASIDVLQLRPAGIVIVSGDRDFMPIAEFAATNDVPIAVFFPQEHSLYALPPGVNYSNRVEITYLTREMMSRCRMSDRRWIEYLQLKVRDRSKFQPCLDHELRRQVGQAHSTKPGSRR